MQPARMMECEGLVSNSSSLILLPLLKTCRLMTESEDSQEPQNLHQEQHDDHHEEEPP